ncbi:MAG: YneF family protein [Malacoplasma sp.]|nr:YneF family protein [Malacoplasma sp.]
MSVGAWIGIIVAVAVVCIGLGIFIGFKIAKNMFRKQMKENPPITEEQIRAMYAQMGRKPSESQVRQIMNNFKKSNDDNK